MHVVQKSRLRALTAGLYSRTQTFLPERRPEGFLVGACFGRKYADLAGKLWIKPYSKYKGGVGYGRKSEYLG